MPLPSQRKLLPEQLRWTCDPGQFDFTTTDDLPELEGTLGQARALASIDFGLDIRESGFNLFLTGEAGTGRTSTIKNILKKKAKTEPIPSDWVYVNNFKSPDLPIALALPAGKGTELSLDMDELITTVRSIIPKALDSKEYENNKATIVEAYQEKNNELFGQLEAEAQEKGFALQRTVSGLVMVPQKEERNYTQEEYEALSDQEKGKLEEGGQELTEKLNDVLRQVRDNEKQTKESLAQLDRDLGNASVGHHIDPLREKYGESPKVLEYLNTVQEDIIANLEDFKPQQQVQSPIPGLKLPRQEPSFERYQVNVFVDNHDAEGAPVVFEPNPTYSNLFGRTEHIMQMGGTATTNFTMIKPGALHRANSGYLIVDAREVLVNPYSWDALKRCIRSAEIKFEDPLEQYRFITIVSMKPEAIPLQAKIIMIGSPWIYYLLYHLEPDYRKFFKVKVDFDSRIARTPEVLKDYALFVSTHCKNEKLLPFDRSGVAGLIEYSARLVEDQEKLSSQFMEIADLIREASYWAGKDGGGPVTHAHVANAIEQKVYRSNRIEERMQELFDDGTILVDVDGAMPGQINGLSVISLGDHTFGRPSRVTARVYLGRAGMVNIEREVKLSGPIHDKGVLILTGYLGGKFAHDKPLSFSASICFEQNYEGVEGDSASSTELYCLLSAFSGVPIRQGIAVTGSVNQHGMIQPIGGVNFKIEGFYAVCKAKGLTGEQGVIIPKSNERHLMLNDEVVQAVRDGKFHIWSVETIDQGIELLTGVAAGERQEDGTYPEESINHLVDKRLREMIESMKMFGASDKDEKKQEGEK
ncbi:peptidase S16 lon domain protein [Geobacter metallireducens RCH3]|uniref:endopeptidase La n=1 Tax=Geobacter metallireducens (strain ATCC 53774 / DSM 7210 / GS-15) TaxID=269799 RepID=Q39S10_GEOMG|nr:ATP-binding protein [Geobacter metallireducens]ABB32964.1 ATP-dependent protease, putative [Geobacter metallireducens GS-15]EHP88900.1 peptidase S16 lon domain protein [Geobacter metallireducens RCH3]